MNATLPDQNGGYCIICYNEIDDSNSSALACKHTFCNECWLDYLKDKVNTDFTGIESTCMQKGCNLKVGHSMYERVLADSKEHLEKYWKWLIKSLTD